MFAAENGLKGDPRLEAISDAIRVIPHFPKPGLGPTHLPQNLPMHACFFQFEFLFVGIMFQDITPLFLNHKVFKDTVDIFVERYRDMAISVVAG